MNMSKVPPWRRCESDEGSVDDLWDGAGAGEASNRPDGAGVGEPSDADGIPSECDVGTGLLEKESRPLNFSRRDSNVCFGIADEAIAHNTALINPIDSDR